MNSPPVNRDGLLYLNTIAGYRRARTLAQLADRFWSKVRINADWLCWLWLGRAFDTGPGQFTVGRSTMHAHRVAWALANGPIPKGAFITHTCNDPLCMNPRHLKMRGGDTT